MDLKGTRKRKPLGRKRRRCLEAAGTANLPQGPDRSRLWRQLAFWFELLRSPDIAVIVLQVRNAMDTLNRDQLRFLSQTRGPFCVSIFLPTHRAGQEIRQDPIRLKNLAKQAETRLISAGLRAVKAREILAPARDLTRRAGF